MELSHRGAQQAGGFGQGKIDAFHGLGIPLVNRFELLPGGKHILQGTVVQRLGQIPLLALLDRDHLGQQVGAFVQQPCDCRYA